MSFEKVLRQLIQEEVEAAVGPLRDAIDALPQFCAITAATVDVTFRFYNPYDDRDLSRPAPIYEVTGTGTLLPGSAPPASGIFDTKSIQQLPSSVGSEEITASTSRGETTYFAVTDPLSGTRLYSADSDSVAQIGGAESAIASPVLSTTPDGRLFVATGYHLPESSTDVVDLTLWTTTGFDRQISFSSASICASAC